MGKNQSPRGRKTTGKRVVQNTKIGGEMDRDLGLNMDEIKKIPKKLYGFLCSGSRFDVKDGNYSKIIRHYGLTNGTLLYSKKLPAVVGFIGHRHNGNTEEFLIWPDLPRCEKSICEMVINLKIICGDSSYEHEESFYRRQGVYIDFRSDIKLIKATHAGIFSAVFSYLENYLEKNKQLVTVFIF